MKVTTIQVRNVNEAFTEGWWRLRVDGVQESSRNGSVLVLPGPCITTYERPCERVLFNAERDANPVFHLVEALWMLAGRDDAKSLLPFNSRYGDYAEADGHVHGAYGTRWRETFKMDQIRRAIDLLKKDLNTRQVVVQMWDADMDLTFYPFKDRPCNTHIYFDARGGSLNMTVVCRSNDMLWGAYGANVVHFSMLQELIARGVGIPVGVYHQFSNNFHVYTDLPMVDKFIQSPPFNHDDRYEMGEVCTTPMFAGDETVQEFLWDCEDFFAKRSHALRTHFFRSVVDPLTQMYLNKSLRSALKVGNLTQDWFVGFKEWCERRESVESK